MVNNDNTVSFEQMKGAIGSLIFLWSQIERELSDSLDVLQTDHSSKHPHGIGRRLELWSYQLQNRNIRRERAAKLAEVLSAHLSKSLCVRNQICHGLVGITAKIRPEDTDAHLTVELGGRSNSLTWTELQEMFGWMSRAGWLIRDLTTASLEPDHQEAEKLLLSWQDFPHQK
ncbi:hypothetical protein [Aliiroseovarius sp. F47248L]|uniref:hypothetical protein n=1 Tax=Aliiroseovarius sp. F47248L TaxID=2926420 RepID=UPI001FF65B63|nr:hypothetical protein [Aliiroseovarius sp. F47248L]MCK0137838.1 hypothetical protein [Aliiroseovarius sp. F47248L]